MNERMNAASRALSMQFGVVLMSVAPAAADVMDKAPSQPALLAWGIGGAIASIYAGSKMPWALFVTISIPFFYFFTLYQELRDPIVGQTLATGGGDSLATIFWTSAVVFAFGATIGMKLGLRRKRFSR